MTLAISGTMKQTLSSMHVSLELFKGISITDNVIYTLVHVHVIK